MAEISLWLDSYDDIYSDFDSRHYLKRRISEDFLDELRAGFRYRKDRVENLTLLIPAKLRKAEIEKEIIASMKEQFRYRFEMFNAKQKNIFRRGIFLIIFGIVIMTIDAFLALGNADKYLTTVIRIILEPMGWFMIWNGLDTLIYDYRKAKKDTSLYQNIIRLQVRFNDL